MFEKIHRTTKIIFQHIKIIIRHSHQKQFLHLTPLFLLIGQQFWIIQAQKSEYSVITFFSLNPYFISFA